MTLFAASQIPNHFPQSEPAQISFTNLSYLAVWETLLQLNNCIFLLTASLWFYAVCPCFNVLCTTSIELSFIQVVMLQGWKGNCHALGTHHRLNGMYTYGLTAKNREINRCICSRKYSTIYLTLPNPQNQNHIRSTEMITNLNWTSHRSRKQFTISQNRPWSLPSICWLLETFLFQR